MASADFSLCLQFEQQAVRFSSSLWGELGWESQRIKRPPAIHKQDKNVCPYFSGSFHPAENSRCLACNKKCPVCIRTHIHTNWQDSTEVHSLRMKSYVRSSTRNHQACPQSRGRTRVSLSTWHLDGCLSHERTEPALIRFCCRLGWQSPAPMTRLCEVTTACMFPTAPSCLLSTPQTLTYFIFTTTLI